MTIDYDKPVRAIVSGSDETYPVEILRAALPPPLVAVGLIYLPRADGKKGLLPCILTATEMGCAQTAQHGGIQLENFEPEPAAFVARSLRVDIPGIRFRTRSGLAAEYVPDANTQDDELAFRIIFPDASPAICVRDKSGKRKPGMIEDDALDIVEDIAPVIRYVRIYDKAKTAKNPTRCENWYEFNSLDEARSNLQGCRGIGVLQYREGDFNPCPRK